MKKNIFKILCLSLIMMLIVGCGCNKKGDKKDKEKDPNEPIVNYQKVSDLDIGTLSFNVSEDKTYITTIIKNNTNEDSKLDKVTISFLDNDKKVIKVFDVKFEGVKKGEEKQVDSVINEALLKTDTIIYTIKKK